MTDQPTPPNNPPAKPAESEPPPISARFGQAVCPTCHAVTDVPAWAPQTNSDKQAPASCRCPNGHRFEAWAFDVIQPNTEPAALAVGDDATCAFHPDKKATTHCAGTGDYICSLCAVPVGGAIYSAAYVEQGHLKAELSKKLSRPDRQFANAFVLSLISGLLCACLPGPLFYIWGWYALIRHFALIKKPGLYAAIKTTNSGALVLGMVFWTALLIGYFFYFFRDSAWFQ